MAQIISARAQGLPQAATAPPVSATDLAKLAEMLKTKGGQRQQENNPNTLAVGLAPPPPPVRSDFAPPPTPPVTGQATPPRSPGGTMGGANGQGIGAGMSAAPGGDGGMSAPVPPPDAAASGYLAR